MSCRNTWNIYGHTPLYDAADSNWLLQIKHNQSNLIFRHEQASYPGPIYGESNDTKQTLNKSDTGKKIPNGEKGIHDPTRFFPDPKSATTKSR